MREMWAGLKRKITIKLSKSRCHWDIQEEILSKQLEIKA